MTSCSKILILMRRRTIGKSKTNKVEAFSPRTEPSKIQTTEGENSLYHERELGAGEEGRG